MIDSVFHLARIEAAVCKYVVLCVLCINAVCIHVLQPVCKSSWTTEAFYRYDTTDGKSKIRTNAVY